MGHKLKRDCKIKWGSLVDSIKSALDIKPVLKSYLKYAILELKEEEWNLLEELYGILMPVKDVVNMICRTEADLLMAEIAFTELFDVLGKIGTPLSEKLLAALKIEVEKRWHPEICGLLKYLNDPSELEKSKAKKKPSAGKFFIFMLDISHCKISSTNIPTKIF